MAIEITSAALDAKYKELRRKAESARSEVLFGLLDELKFHPDALRNAIGSEIGRAHV